VAPVISAVSLQKTSGGVTLTFSGYSTTKEATHATIQFNAATGASLTAPTITVPLTATLGAWYSSAAASAFGSQFSLGIPFTISGDVSAIGSVTVVLANSQGNSAPVTGTFK
jgi:hypothetical protein